MSPHLVRLRWFDREAIEPPRLGQMVLPRGRAEALVDWILRTHGTRYLLILSPEAEMLTFFDRLKVAASRVEVFIGAHKSEISAATAFVGGLAFPPPYGTILHIAAVGLAALAGTKYGK